MSVQYSVYIGEAVELVRVPESWKDIIEEHFPNRFAVAHNGNEDTLPYLIPNQGEGSGVWFSRNDDPLPLEVCVSTIQRQQVAFLNEYRKDVDRLSSEFGWEIHVACVVLSDWY